MKKMIKFKERVRLLYLEKDSDVDEILKRIVDIDVDFENYYDMDNDNGVESRLKSIIKKFEFPITIVYEPYYVDWVYRDEYYRYYAKKHFSISRNTKRLIFIQHIYRKDELLSNDSETYKKIEDDLIGMVVIKPTRTIGRTLLKPSKLKIPRCYIRSTNFEMSVCGRKYSLEAFPFSGQDSEVMTCAEVNIWQIMEYFGNRYKDYKTLLPSELVDLVKESSEVRTLPSDGLTVEQESSLFMKNGLSPLIYYKYMEYQNGDTYRLCEQYTDPYPSFYDILHFYVESGIPVLLNLTNKNNPKGDNHSITCIGHEYIKTEELISEMESIEIEIDENELDKEMAVKYNKIQVLKSWSGYKKYVMMEDHSSPYQVKDLSDLVFDDFPMKQDEPTCWDVESFVVPLYKHVFMPAEDVYMIALNLIEENFEEICRSIGCDCKMEKPQIVVRLYLTTSKSYKDFRVRKVEGLSLEDMSERLFFSQVDYPKFLWVCEYGTMEAYTAHKANGELVFDATSSMDYSVISIRHGEMVTYRSPMDDIDSAYVPIDLKLNRMFAMYESNNLKDSHNI